MKKEMICISCPIGCHLTVDATSLNDIKVTGNQCPRGAVYGKNEITDPRRTVTTTVALDGGGTVSVKTSSPVKKDEIFTVLKKLKSVSVKSPINVGDIVVENITENINIISTQKI